MAARILIVAGAPSATQDQLVAYGGRRHGANYAAVLAAQAPDGLGGIDSVIVHAADGDPLPDATALSMFDGIVWTGSPLAAYTDTPIVRRQIAFALTAFQSGRPCFGSCWGLQVMMAALGGTVQLNPNGPELGVARAITLNADGRAHPLFTGKPAIFDALCVHQDEVSALPASARLLAGNAMCAVQAVVVEDEHHSFWGVQYHPEYDLLHIAAMFRRNPARLVTHGMAATIDAAQSYAEDLATLQADPSRADVAARLAIGADITDRRVHCRELANWLSHEVAPRMAERRR